MNNRQIADELSVDEASVRRGLRKAGYKPYLLPQHVLDKFVVALDKPYVIDVAAEGPGAVTADWHLPLTDFDLVNTFLDHAVDVGATNYDRRDPTSATKGRAAQSWQSIGR